MNFLTVAFPSLFLFFSLRNISLLFYVILSDLIHLRNSYRTPTMCMAIELQRWRIHKPRRGGQHSIRLSRDKSTDGQRATDVPKMPGVIPTIVRVLLTLTARPSTGGDTRPFLWLWVSVDGTWGGGAREGHSPGKPQSALYKEARKWDEDRGGSTSVLPNMVASGHNWLLKFN